MRSQVRRIGTLSGMELLVDFFRELSTDPLDLRQVLYARAHDPLQAAEPREQLLAAFGADPRDALPARYPAVAARQRLRESAVVVARLHAFDVVATVFAPAHVHAIVHHAGRHRGLAHGVAHIEAFDTLHGVGQAQRLAQRREPRFLGAVLGELRLQGLKRVLPGHLEPGAALGRGTRVNAHAAFRVLAERGLELFDVELFADDQRRRYRPLQVRI